MYRSGINWERVIAVTNRKLCGNDFFDQIRKIGNLGVRAIILREKDLTPQEYEQMAEKVLRICDETDTLCILHNFPHVAKILGCRDLHLPLPVLEEVTAKEHTAYEKYKKMPCLNEKVKDVGWRYLGTSVHSVKQAVQAEDLGVTYMAAGHVFATDCKPGLPPRGIDFFQNICQTVKVPVYGIGGIHTENMNQVIDAGAAGVCMMSEMMKL